MPKSPGTFANGRCHPALSLGSRPPLLVQKLDNPLLPYVFQFLGVQDGSQVSQWAINYSGYIVKVMNKAVGSWLRSNSEVRVIDHPAGFSIRSMMRYADSDEDLPVGAHFLEIGGLRAVLMITPIRLGFPEIIISLHARREDIARFHDVPKQWEEAIGAVKGVWDGGGNPLPRPDASAWSGLAWPAETRRHVEDNSINLLRLWELRRDRRIPIKRGLLLWGPPGNGKSSVIKYLTTKIPRVVIASSSDVNPCRPSPIRDLYDFARKMSPCLVVIEDIDAVGGGSREDDPTRRLGEILNELDGFDSNEGIITVATTNDIRALDSALADRPGRFDVKLHFPNPDQAQRLELLGILTRDVRLAEDVDLKALSRSLEGRSLSCAHLKEIVTRSLMAAVEERPEAEPTLTKRRIEKALELVAPLDAVRSIGFKAA